MDTNAARSTEAEQRLCSEALTYEVGLLQNTRSYKWIPLSVEKKSFPSKESDTKTEYVFCLQSRHHQLLFQ